MGTRTTTRGRRRGPSGKKHARRDQSQGDQAKKIRGGPCQSFKGISNAGTEPSYVELDRIEDGFSGKPGMVEGRRRAGCMGEVLEEVLEVLEILEGLRC